MRRFYIITMWSGGHPAKKWKSSEPPETLPTGTGVRFRSVDTRLMVEVIGSISIEEFEQGMEIEEADLPPVADAEVDLPPGMDS